MEKKILVFFIFIFSWTSILANNLDSDPKLKNSATCKLVDNKLIIEFTNSNKVNKSKTQSNFTGRCRIVIDTDKALLGATDKCIREAGIPIPIFIPATGDWMVIGTSITNTIENISSNYVALFKEAKACDPVDSIMIYCEEDI